MDTQIVKSEKEMKNWFLKNYEALGYSQVVRPDRGTFPDFIMKRDNGEIYVELETKLSHFFLHKHDETEVDEIICIENDVPDSSLKCKIIQIKDLIYVPRIKRISATIDKETNEILKKMLRQGKYRNKSHIIEESIKLLKETNDEHKK